MSRDQGFRNADLDVGFLDDPKIRALVRSTKDEGLVSRCIVAYISTVTSSWADGARIKLADAAPVWLSGLEDIEQRLRGVGLLDESGAIPEHAWQGWYGPAAQRRDDRRYEGLVGGLMRSLGLDKRSAEAEARRRLAGEALRGTSGDPSSDLTRSVPSVPTHPSVPSDPGSPQPLPHPTESSYTASGRGRGKNGNGANGLGRPSWKGTRVTDEDLPDHLRVVVE